MNTKAIDLYVLLLYPATYPICLMSSSSISVKSFLFPYMENHDICKQGQLDFRLSDLHQFNLFFLSNGCKTIFNGRGETGHPVVPDLRGNASNFSPLNMMLAMDFSYIDFIVLRNVLSILYLLKVFVMKVYCGFYPTLSLPLACLKCTIEALQCIFHLRFCNVKSRNDT